MEAFERVRLPGFEDYMVGHLEEFNPFLSNILGDGGIRTLIRAAMKRAADQGFTHRGPVKFFIETAILLGIEFDSDPQYAQARRILGDATRPDQTERADDLHAWLTELLIAVAGPHRKHARRALREIRRQGFDTIPLSRSDFADRAIGRLWEVYPEKVEAIGDGPLRGLIPRALEEAQGHGIATDAGVCLLLGLMFAFGHGFVRDPKYPWATAILSDRALADPHAKVERLYSGANDYLDQVLEHREEL